MVLAVGSGAAQQQDLGALSVTVLTGQVESGVSCLGQKKTNRTESEPFLTGKVLDCALELPVRGITLFFA